MQAAAQRERRRMQLEMEPLYRDYDVLVTASGSPAPRFDQYSPRNAWDKPILFTPFSVTAGPALAICNGYTTDGLPLSMQIAAAPFAEEKVLRVAHAYEKATPWRERRPALVPGTPRAEVTPPATLAGNAVDASVTSFVEQQVRRCGLKLNDLQMALLCEVAPYAQAMADRVRRNFDRAVEPANVFRFPD